MLKDCFLFNKKYGLSGRIKEKTTFHFGDRIS